MKKILIAAAIIFALSFNNKTSNAQVSVSINIGIQPDWGPVGYDYVEYYYIPQYKVYYYVPKMQFIYFDGVKWIFVTKLPARFGTVDLYRPYKVVINEPQPWLHFKEHQVKYASYKSGGNKQEVIRDSKDPKYVEARNKSKSSHQNNAKPENAHKEKEAQKKEQPKAAPAHNESKEKEKEKDHNPKQAQLE